MGEGIRVAAVLDPFGNRLGIIEKPHFSLAAVRRLWTQDVAEPGEIELLDEKYVEVSGNVDWSSGPYRVTGVAGVELATGSFMAARRKTNGKWFNVQEIRNNDRLSAPVAPAK